MDFFKDRTISVGWRFVSTTWKPDPSLKLWNVRFSSSCGRILGTISIAPWCYSGWLRKPWALMQFWIKACCDAQRELDNAVIQEFPHVSGLTIGIHGQNVDIFELPNINSYLWWFKICANLCYSITWSMLFAYWASSIPNAVMIAARRLCNSTCPDSRLYNTFQIHTCFRCSTGAWSTASTGRGQCRHCALKKAAPQPKSSANLKLWGIRRKGVEHIQSKLRVNIIKHSIQYTINQPMAIHRAIA